MTHSNQKKMAITLVALTVVLSLMLTPAPWAGAADHGDAPFNNGDQSADMADTFVFLDPTDNTRVIIAMTLRGFIASGENNNFGQFDPTVRHRFEIDLTGDPRPERFIDVTFAKRTGSPANAPLNTSPQNATVMLMDGQTFTVPTTPSSVCIAGSANCPPAPVITDLGTTGVRFYAGMRDDPFNFDIPAFVAATAALRACIAAANPPDGACVGAALANFQRGRDSFAGYNLMSIALSIPRALFTPGCATACGFSILTTTWAEHFREVSWRRSSRTSSALRTNDNPTKSTSLSCRAVQSRSCRSLSVSDLTARSLPGRFRP